MSHASPPQPNQATILSVVRFTTWFTGTIHSPHTFILITSANTLTWFIWIFLHREKTDGISWKSASAPAEYLMCETRSFFPHILFINEWKKYESNFQYGPGTREHRFLSETRQIEWHEAGTKRKWAENIFPRIFRAEKGKYSNPP